MSKIKRIIAGLLAALNILTIMPLVDTGQLMDAAYADNGTHVGDTDGDVVVTVPFILRVDEKISGDLTNSTVNFATYPK